MATVQDYASALSRMLGLVDNERTPDISPDTERRHQPRYDLTRIQALLKRLGNPEVGTPAVHIAGSKGKGSTAAMCANILRSQGYSVGMYSSPHLHTFRERIAVHGEPITEAQFANVLSQLWDPMLEVNAHSDGRVTVFELLTAMGLTHFRDMATDFNVIEVGLGGRLDATNVIVPTVSVITSLSLDHTRVLGDTLEEIAWEKAGIIKPGVPVVTAPQLPSALEVIRDTCRQRNAPLTEVGSDVQWHAHVEDFPASSRVAPPQRLQVQGRHGACALHLSLLGSHQQENAATAVAVMEILKEHGHHISCQAVAEGLATVEWPCRLEILSGRERGPLIVADGAHNPHSAQRLCETLSDCFHYDNALLLFGASRDKDLNGIVSALAPAFSQTVVTATRHPRSAAPEVLVDLFLENGVRASYTQETSDAISLAMEMAGENDLILATGSLFLAAEVREVVKGIPPEIYADIGGI